MLEVRRGSTRSTSKPSTQLQQQSACSENCHRRQLMVHNVIARAAFDHAHAPAPACSRACVFLVVLCLLCLFSLASRPPATPSAHFQHRCATRASRRAGPRARLASRPHDGRIAGRENFHGAGLSLLCWCRATTPLRWQCGSAALAVRIRCVSCADPLR